MFSITDMLELAILILVVLDPEFPKKIIPGKSVIVAGKNFGLGSSREQAPLVIKESGIIAVLASSFARIFYRNSFNIGLALVQTDTADIAGEDILDIDLGKGLIKNNSQNTTLKIKPLPRFMQDILTEGGIVNYYKKYSHLPNV